MYSSFCVPVYGVCADSAMVNTRGLSTYSTVLAICLPFFRFETSYFLSALQNRLCEKSLRRNTKEFEEEGDENREKKIGGNLYVCVHNKL